jgi:DNA mismatch repair protein MutS2
MDGRALELLELPAILERLAGAAASEPGRALALALVPSADPDEVRARQALTTEAVGLLDHAAEPELGRVREIRPSLELAARGGVLDPAALRHVASAVEQGVAARRALEAFGGAPQLTAVAAGIDPGLRSLADELHAAIEEDGSDVRDGASPALRRLRRELREGRARLAERLRRLARDPALRDHLSDDFVTERAGRPVLALRASARGSVPGIVHDSSGSGQTLFVEPLAVVDDSNRLREAESAEREELARILRELSRGVGDRAAALDALVDAVSELDLAIARGVLSRRWRGAEVTPSDEVVLRDARHPLLDPGTAVPIDLELGTLRAVVVSGPNTGGKTVALKTLGLSALLHQCGLRPPARHAELPVFDQVLADIGDEQSIAMSLSTFSGHVRNLVAILERAGERSLVLLDEVAAGTDPVEGAALARAILGRLAGQARLTLATSHYAELKEWASATDGAANAATGFDPETEAPLYRIALGRAGTSHALRIAERLGLPAAVIEEARLQQSPERLRVAELLAEAEAAERGAAEARERAAGEQTAAEAARLAAERRVAELEEEIERVRASAAAERERIVAATERELAAARAELVALRDEIRAARKLERDRRRASTPTAAAKERERDRRLGAASERAARAGRAIRDADEPLPQTAPLAAGDPVVAPELGVRGTLVEVGPTDAVVIGRGGLRVRVPVARLRPDRDAAAEGVVEQAVTVRATTPADAPDELDVRGLTAQEAREALRGFVDTAALAGRFEVRVIHGRGTGAVRAAVRDELARHPLVVAHESDSADGATLVRLGTG